MRRRGALFSGATFFVLAACSGFGGDDAEVPPPEATTGSATDAGGSDAEGEPVVGSTGDFSFSIPQGELRLVTGATAPLEVTVTRRGGFTGNVSITLTGSTRFTAPPIEIAPTETKGVLQVSAAADAAQGEVKDALVQASSNAQNTATLPLKGFIRGAAGVVDTTYGTDGKADLASSATFDPLRATVDEKGRAVVWSGTSLTRATVDGVTDSSIVPQATGLRVAKLASIANKIYVCGDGTEAGQPRLGIARLLENGMLDISYGTSGFTGVVGGFPAGNNTGVVGCAVSATNSVFSVVSSDVDQQYFQYVLYWRNADGAVAFNPAGYSSPGEAYYGGAFAPAGFFGITGGTLTKFTSTGLYDTPWGTNGKRLLPQSASDIVRMNDGKLLVAGPTLLAKYLDTGVEDSAFAGAVPPQSSGTGSSIALQPDGKIVKLVWANASKCRLERHEATGAFDTAFGDNGIVDLPTPCIVRAVGLQPDGRIIVAGQPTFRVWN